jgi:hypothetical protein
VVSPVVTTAPGVPGVTLTPSELSGLYRQDGGLSGDGLTIAIAMTLRESGGVTNALNPNDSGSPSRGLVQWRKVSHPEISDADAYDPVATAQWLNRKSAGGTNFGPWGMGPNSYLRGRNDPRGEDLLPALMSSAYWAPARAAAAAPVYPAAKIAQLRAGVGTGGDTPTPGDWVDRTCPGATPAERAMLMSWGVEDNGWRIVEADDEWEFSEIDEEHYDALTEVVNEYVQPDGSIRTGWLLAVKTALGVSPTAVLSPSINSSLQQMLHARQGRYGGPDPGLIDGVVQNVVDEGVLGALTPDWANGLGQLIGNLLRPTFWRRIGIVLLGCLLVAVAVGLIVKGQALAAVGAAE